MIAIFPQSVLSISQPPCHPATMSIVSYVYLTITVYFTRVEVLKANICKTISYHLTVSLSLLITMSLEDIIVYCLLVGKYAAL